MSLTKVRSVGASLLVLVNLVLVLLDTANVTHWDKDTQTVAVYSVANTLVFLVIALYAHFYPGTKKEPVAIAAAVTTFVVSIITLAFVFVWFSWDVKTYAAIVAIVPQVVGLVAFLFAREQVTADPTKPVDAPPGV